MAHAYYHAKSSARRFGGIWNDYITYHEWMDSTKAHVADARHRLVLHNSWGIFLGEQVYGRTFTRASDGKEMPLRPILEQHVTEDLGSIPTLEQALSTHGITEAQPWMYRKAQPLSQREEKKKMTTTTLSRVQLAQRAREYRELADWTLVRDFCNQVYGEGKVHTLEVETHGEYNDEGGTNYSIESMTAKDEDGQELSFDLSTPFWKSEKVQKYLNDEDEETFEDEDEDRLTQILRDIWYGSKDPEKDTWVFWDDLPCSEDWETYNLAEMPTISV